MSNPTEAMMKQKKAEDRSKSGVSGMKNSGPGQGQYKAGVGDPIDMGLSSQEFMKGGSARKLRQVTDEATQRPECYKETVKSDRGSFTYPVN
jgi:hypothetical protein